MTAEIIYREVSALSELEGNPRTITKKQFEKLKTSLKNNPDYFEARPLILSDRTGALVVIAGNQRLRAAKSLGLKEVPTVLLEGLTEEREREIIIRDNVENGEWDMEALANAWSTDDLIEWGVEEIKPFKEIVEVEPAPVDEENTYSVLGEIYQLGDHRVYCGSFEDEDKLVVMFGTEKATCTFTDPPYNINYRGRGSGKTIANDNMAREEFQSFLERALECVKAHTVAGGGVISWMSDAEILTLRRAFDTVGLNFKTFLCWVKSSFGLGHGDFRNAREPAIYGLNEGEYPTDETDQPDEGQFACYARDAGGKFAPNRNLSNVWFFPRPTKSKDHPTMKPVALCAKGVLALSEPGDIVFDPFLGSGSTLIACEQTGRRCFGCELDPNYVDVIRKRYWKATTGSEEGWQDGTI